MRYFDNLDEAIHEIHRDIYKASKTKSSRVQAAHVEATAHEALNYSYTIAAGGIPDSVDELQSLMPKTLFPELTAHHAEVRDWLINQLHERISTQDIVADFLHPLLAKTAEGQHFSYTYAERLSGALLTAARILEADKDSRRCYIPIYWPVDFFRAAAPTRIPCSLGYSFFIREVPGLGDFLHMTYLQRSSDFSRFWVTDVWLAHQFQLELLRLLQTVYPNLKLGNFSHNILSFHIFDDGVKEVY